MIKNILKVAQGLVMLWVIPYVYHNIDPSMNDWWAFSFVASLAIIGFISYMATFDGVLKMLVKK